jgi:hypothetical protein
VAITEATIHHVRSAALFITGLGVFVYEVGFNEGERPTILILAAACMGLPAFLGLDERRKEPADKPREKD